MLTLTSTSTIEQGTTFERTAQPAPAVVALVEQIRRQAVSEALESVAWWRGNYYVGHPDAETLLDVQVERVMARLRKGVRS